MFMPADLANNAQGKQKTAIMFDPQSEREAKRKRMMAELLIQQGNTPLKNEQAGGMTVARSPWENMNQAAQKYMGQYQLEGADNQMAEAELRRQEMIREALSNQDPMQAAQVLAQDPNTSDAAIKMYSDVLSDQRRLEQLKTVGGRMGATPAPMQVAGRMFELEQAIHNPNLSQQERFLAQREYSLLGQSAKTYGFDRGLEAAGGIAGYEQVFRQQPMDVPMGSTPFVPQQPQQPMPPMAQGGMPQQGMPQGMQPVQGQDPLQEHRDAVMQQQQQMGTSPMQRSDMVQAGGVQPIQGYGEAVGSIAAAKKGAETRADLLTKLDIEPKIEKANMDARGEISEREEQRTKAKSAYSLATRNAGNVIQDSGRAVEILDRAGRSAAGWGALLSTLPDTDARALRGHIDSVKSNIAIDKLLEIKAAGSGLGQVPQSQLDMLANTQGNLDQAQTVGDLMDNLKRTQNIYVDVLKAARGEAVNFGYDASNTDFVKSFVPNELSFDEFGRTRQQPQQDRNTIIEKLRADGTISEERINQYLQSLGF